MSFELDRMVWMAQCEQDFAGQNGWLSSIERTRAESMRFTKRRMDYMLGRWTAKTTLVRISGWSSATVDELARYEVRNAADGSPRAFLDGGTAGWSIAMTDRAGWGVCALASPSIDIGCDLELVEPRSDLFISDYLTSPEQEVVRSAAPGDARDLRANLMWSAKESALKVLRTGLRRDTRSVEVSLIDDGAVQEWSRLVVACLPGPILSGWWKRFGHFVLTVASSSELPPPTCLGGDDRLSAGRPTHTWMERPTL